LRDEWKNIFKNDATLPKETMVKALKFGAFVIDEAKSVGKAAFQLQLPFNEKSVLETTITYLKKEIGIEDIAVMEAEVAIASGNKNLINFGNNATPGKPQVMLE